MTNACITRIHFFHHKATTLYLPQRNKFQFNLFRPFPTCASLASTSLGYNPQWKTITLTSQLSPSGAPAQRSEEWFALRKDRLTTSTFSTALGLWKGKRRYELWCEKVFPSDTNSTVSLVTKHAMEWGVLNESTAIEKYKIITGREVNSLGFATHSEDKFDWIGASPDGLLGNFANPGILEVKCPFNKGKPASAKPWTTMPFYYMPQVQGQMEVMDRDWVDLYCWTENGSTIFRVSRDEEYWKLIHGVLREFWWENVVPAREALLMGSEVEARKYEPTSVHKLTGLIIHKSLKLASESKLLCREVAGHVEFL
ncbi:putative restriction endonuclease type II, exonuclease, phage-type/RecB, YqaJ viral recombinase [Helianthus annuus]|nr:putative restriction endonuclease type II, exonuclease, phage-type/RecB, YqaJ viral recombinase [Helianthus annuus]KAJ0811892.1 putative restriction endonuclease type II, exonuclease, phage-type/RecB, YqaJ viral recombinase [Helianthus annuus]